MTGHNKNCLRSKDFSFCRKAGTGQSKDKKGSSLLVWTFICLGLLLNIVVNAVLSASSPFQQFGFDQPNVTILNFPFSWLPAFIVPLVLFAHLATIRRLINHSWPLASSNIAA
ncbi:hypothetical protein [Pedobacter jejuensis]|uniref:hypothetical protein n=2 Tax=Pedobacter TaxID=84567 RepID=UPI001ABEF768|nr:hypothetical protein [Pedobacter jejuensis]